MPKFRVYGQACHNYVVEVEAEDKAAAEAEALTLLEANPAPFFDSNDGFEILEAVEDVDAANDAYATKVAVHGR